jgi:predicted dehydrogenase
MRFVPCGGNLVLELEATGKINRRSFLDRSAKAAAGTALATTALSYSRILGANDRISLSQIGIGDRGGELGWIASRLKDAQNVKVSAVCGLWTVHLQKAVAANSRYYGRGPRAFQHPEDLLANGAIGNVESFREALYGYDIRTEIVGTRGTLMVGHLRHTPKLVLTRGGVSHDVVDHFLVRFADAYLIELRDFVQMVRKGTTPAVTGEDGRKAMAIALAAQRSYRESRPVAVSDDADRDVDWER